MDKLDNRYVTWFTYPFGALHDSAGWFTLCVKCSEPYVYHVNYLCLYSPTKFEPAITYAEYNRGKPHYSTITLSKIGTQVLYGGIWRCKPTTPKKDYNLAALIQRISKINAP